MRNDPQNQKPGHKQPEQDRAHAQKAEQKTRQSEQKPATGQRQQDTSKTPRQH